MLTFLIIFSLGTSPVWLPKLYFKLRVPWREADFTHRHFKYWFDERIGYSELARVVFKFEVDRQNRYGKDMLRAVKGSRYYESGALDMEVQIAYRNHIHNKFEEIVLEQSNP